MVSVEQFNLNFAVLSLATEMRTELEPKFKDRRVRLKMIKNTFLHADGMEWLEGKVQAYENEARNAKETADRRNSASGESISSDSETEENLDDMAEDDLLQWRAAMVGNSMVDTGYVAHATGSKHGFRATQKTKKVFRFHDREINNDLRTLHLIKLSDETKEYQRRKLFTQRLCIDSF